MSVHTAKPGDLYADANGKLWRVVAVCQEPTVTVEEVENARRYDLPVRQCGGVSGAMWHGFHKLVPEPRT